ncbi:polysaccharide biosynthesis tyrosine autokinase [Pseudomonas brenneri]
MQQSHVQQDTDNDEMDLLGLLGAVVDYKWIIAAITVVFMVAGATYAILATPKYQANALVQVEAKKNDLLGFTDISSMLGKESPSVTEIEIIKSRSIIGEAIDTLKLNITVKPNYFPVVGSFIARRYVKKNPDNLADPLLPLQGFAWGGELLKVGKLQLPDLLLGTKLTLIAGDKGEYVLLNEDGDKIAESKVGEFYSANGVSINVEKIRANPGTKFLIVCNPRLTSILDYQDALDIAERGKESGIIGLSLESEDPDLAIRTLNEIADIYVRQNIERTSAEAAKSLDFLNDQLPKVRKDLEKSEDALNAYQTRSKSVDITLETKAILDQIVSLDTNISELKLKQAEMDRKFTPEHPAYRALMTQLGELTNKQDRLAKKVQSLPSTQQELLSLTRDVRVGTEIYTQLLNRSQELDVMRAGTVGNVRLIDRADVDRTKPVKPKKILIVLVATLFGAFLAVALVLLRKAINRGIESAEIIEKLGLPVYASVPYSVLQKAEEQKKTRGPSRTAKAISLLAINHPTDLSIEALRSLRTSLHFGMLDAKNNLLMISGPSPNVGKTFISANLAAVVAQSGQRVLLIDLDMRRGNLHDLLGISHQNGVSDILVHRCDVSTAIHKTKIEGFDFMSRGERPPNPSELLMRSSFKDLLDEVSSMYDLVILDTPPLLAVTDAAIVGRQCGTSLIVARFGLNPAREIELTINRFAQNGIKLAGAIFNGVEKRTSANYGYSGYGYYHYEYKDEKAKA